MSTLVMQNELFQRGGYEELGANLSSAGLSEHRSFTFFCITFKFNHKKSKKTFQITVFERNRDFFKPKMHYQRGHIETPFFWRYLGLFLKNCHFNVVSKSFQPKFKIQTWKINILLILWREWSPHYQVIRRALFKHQARLLHICIESKFLFFSSVFRRVITRQKAENRLNFMNFCLIFKIENFATVCVYVRRSAPATHTTRRPLRGHV